VKAGYGMRAIGEPPMRLICADSISISPGLRKCWDIPHTDREIWNGDPERLPDVLRVKQPKSGGTLSAACEL
jgi:hypothetical protein